jgi:CRP/FNR family transcriptional regulator, cyclic AMP receptor protein
MSVTSARSTEHRFAPPRGVKPGFHIHTMLLGLPRERTDALLDGARRLELDEGKILFSRGDVGDGCYWLEEGRVKVTIASPRGQQRILAVLGPGAIVGEIAMIDGLPRTATVEALQPCRLLFVARTSFLSWLEASPDLHEYLVKTLVARLRQADEEAAAASFLSGRARVARALLHLAAHLGEPSGKEQLVVRDKLRQGDLAALAGVTRESVSRIVSDWVRLKMVEHPSRSTYVIKVSELEREAAETA